MILDCDGLVLSGHHTSSYGGESLKDNLVLILSKKCRVYRVFHDTAITQYGLFLK